MQTITQSTSGFPLNIFSFPLASHGESNWDTSLVNAMQLLLNKTAALNIKSSIATTQKYPNSVAYVQGISSNDLFCNHMIFLLNPSFGNPTYNFSSINLPAIVAGNDPNELKAKYITITNISGFSTTVTTAGEKINGYGVAPSTSITLNNNSSVTLAIDNDGDLEPYSWIVTGKS
jgi:hypothetical protein